MNIEEKAIEVLKHCKDRNFSAFDKIYFDDGTNMCIYQAIETLLTAYEKEKEKNENAKWYLHQEIVRIGEDIEDYIDDDKEGNKHIIGEFKEDLKQWLDVEKLLQGKSKDELYIDWRKYGEYE